LTNLFTYLAYIRNVKRIKSDWNKAVEEWKRIGGINASTGQLLNFMYDYSLTLVEYATWTETDLDDKAIAMIRSVLIDHRDTLICMIDWLRKGREPNTTELITITESACASPNEYGSPLTILSILLTIYQVLYHLMMQGTEPPQPTPDTIPPERKRPVITFIRKIFNKQ